MAGVGRCQGCGRVMCAGCEHFSGMVPRCDACARVSRARRTIVTRRLSAALLAVGMTLSLGLGLVLGMAQAQPDSPPLPSLVVVP
jgi:hypothetical protein